MSEYERVLVFPDEGRQHMQNCIAAAFEHAKAEDVRKVIVFTGNGEGPVFAVQNLLSQEQYATLEMIAVTPPVGRPYKLNPLDDDTPIVQAGIQPTIRDFLESGGVAVISAHLPFKQVGRPTGPIADMLDVGEALAIFGGGMPLCVQAVLLACDAGRVEVGERVVVASADTAILAWATRTETFLSKSEGFVVEKVICHPARQTVSKRDHMRLRYAPPPAQPTQQLTTEGAPAALIAAPEEPKTTGK